MILSYQIRVNITTTPPVTATPYTITVSVAPASIPVHTAVLEYPYTVTVAPIEIDVTSRVRQLAREFTDQIFANYIDESRNLRTLVNLGDDRQSVALAWRQGTTPSSMQVKLLSQLNDDIQVGDSAFISRELAQTVVDTFRVRLAPEIDESPYLRPRNSTVKVYADLGRTLNQVTYNLLQLETGSFSAIDTTSNPTFENQIYRRWYTFDFNSSELNIDFTNYKNFVFYGSAAMRLAAFKQKLQQLEFLEVRRKQFEDPYNITEVNNTGITPIFSYVAGDDVSGATFTRASAGSSALYDVKSFTAALPTVGAQAVKEFTETLAIERETIIRSFDRYEQYLYFTAEGSESPYSAEFAHTDSGVEYNSIGYWPKVDGQPAPVDSAIAIAWYTTQLSIAERFDAFNENALVNTIPTYIQDDVAANGAYITFIAMIGHYFDNIKPYIDQFPNIYNRNIDPDEGLSKDLVTDVAEAMGFQLPTLNSVYSLGESMLSSLGETSRREYTVETHKRLLHNLPLFAKAKGTKTALSTLLKTFGISEQLIRVRELGSVATERSEESYTEYSTGFKFNQQQNVSMRLPISASLRTPPPAQIQFSIQPTKKSSMTVATGDSSWALRITQHESNTNLARFELTSGSSHAVLLSSSYYSMYDETLMNVTLRTYTDTQRASLSVYHIEDGVTRFSSFMQEPISANKFLPLWNSTANVHLGGSGSLVQTRLDAIIDEVRVWGTALSNEMVLVNSMDPGSIAGDTFTDPTNLLYVQLSFAATTTGSLSNSVRNETPYTMVGAFPSLTNISMIGAQINSANFVRYLRHVKTVVPYGGVSLGVTDKIKVAPAPVFTSVSTTANGVKQLSRTASIVSPKNKTIQRGRNKVGIFVSPTDIINKNIIRTLGIENVNSAISSPSVIFDRLSNKLPLIKQHYAKYYYVDVNINNFIRVLSNTQSVLNEVVEYFIPSKATLLKGVVIEQNILDKVKIPRVKSLRVYGKHTRKTDAAPTSLESSTPDYDATFNVEQTITVHPSIPQGIAPFYTASVATEFQEVNASHVTSDVIMDGKSITELGGLDMYTVASIHTPTPMSTASLNTVDSTLEPLNILDTLQVTDASTQVRITHGEPSADGTFLVYDLQHQSWEEFRLLSMSQNPESPAYLLNRAGLYKKSAIPMQLDSMNKISYNDDNYGEDGAEPYNRVYPRKLFAYEIEETRVGGVTSLQPTGLQIIQPSANLDDIGVTTHFNRRTGIYYVPQTFLVPRTTMVLNQTWNFEEQEFENIRTWQYGESYNYQDVVYQDVDELDKNLPLDIIRAARAGNGKYYVMKSRPEYFDDTPDVVPIFSYAVGDRFDGATFTRTSPASFNEVPPAPVPGIIPTFLPPSLDNIRWRRLYFKPIERRVPKRAIFDTFRNPDIVKNNYAITTLDINTVIDTTDRYVDRFEIPSIQSSDRVTGEISVQNIAVLFALQSSQRDIRVRLYRTAAGRDADMARGLLDVNYQNSGVLLDTVIATDNEVKYVNTIATLVADSFPPGGKIFYTVDNLSSSPKTSISILLYYFAVEIEPRIPRNYLPKHYRFFRDNGTATKRRNWAGCKNTDRTTIDGQPVVQVFIGEGTVLSISPTNKNDEIVTGGEGPLNIG